MTDQFRVHRCEYDDGFIAYQVQVLHCSPCGEAFNYWRNFTEVEGGEFYLPCFNTPEAGDHWISEAERRGVSHLPIN